jgi:hypothetical protein
MPVEATPRRLGWVASTVLYNTDLDLVPDSTCGSAQRSLQYSSRILEHMLQYSILEHTKYSIRAQVPRRAQRQRRRALSRELSRTGSVSSEPPLDPSWGETRPDPTPSARHGPSQSRSFYGTVYPGTCPTQSITTTTTSTQAACTGRHLTVKLARLSISRIRRGHFPTGIETRNRELRALVLALLLPAPWKPRRGWCRGARH